MAAKPKVSVEQIETALEATGGTVQRAAKVLRISKNALYKRMARVGMHPDSYRMGDAHHAQRAMVDSGDAARAADALRTPSDARRKRPRDGGDSSAATFPGDAQARTFPNVQQANTTAAADEPRALRESRNWFLRPEQIEAVRQAKFDLQAKLRLDLSDSKVIEMFLDEAFGGWLRSKLGQPEPAAARRKKGGSE